MFVIGKCSRKEIKEMKSWGWDVEDVDVAHFDKALDPKAKTDDTDRYEKHGDKLVSIFVDSDMYDLFKKWHGVEVSLKKLERDSRLRVDREKNADEAFSEASHELLEIPDDCEVIDSDGWETEDDSLIRRFYYSNPDGGDSLVGSFRVVFKHDSDRVVDVYSNTH